MSGSPLATAFRSLLLIVDHAPARNLAGLVQFVSSANAAPQLSRLHIVRANRIPLKTLLKFPPATLPIISGFRRILES